MYLKSHKEKLIAAKRVIKVFIFGHHILTTFFIIDRLKLYDPIDITIIPNIPTCLSVSNEFFLKL